MMNRRFTVERSSMIIKGITIAVAIALGAGCASADSRQDKVNYRQAQVQAIKIQTEADMLAAQAASAERVAMWRALAEASARNPEVGTHMAIVAAVASTNAPAAGVSDQSDNITLQPERDVQAIDYLKVLAPGLIGGVTQAGIAAISADVNKRRSDNATRVRISEITTDGQVWGTINNAIDELDDNELTPGTTDVVVEDVVETEEVETTDEVVDDVIDIPDVVEPTDDVVNPVDCDVTFSPAPPECS